MRILFQLICLFLWFLPLHVQGLNFTIRDMGTLMSEESVASGINNQNVVVGAVKQEGVFTNFVWEQSKGLTLLPFTCSYQLPRINNRGQIASIFWLRTNYWIYDNTQSKHLYIVNADGSHQDLGFPKNWKIQKLEDWQTIYLWDEKELKILAFNDHQILLTNSLTLEKATQFAIWENGVFKEIHPDTLSIAYKINQQGVILGRKWKKTEEGNIPMLVLYDWNKGTTTEIMKDVNLLYHALNDQGQVIAFQVTKDQKVMKGFLWDCKQGLTHLDDFAPIAINNCRQMVGLKISEIHKEIPVVLLWDQGKVMSLNKMTGIGEAESLWSSILSIGGINDNGYIIGKGMYDGKRHAFVLIPSKD